MAIEVLVSRLEEAPTVVFEPGLEAVRKAPLPAWPSVLAVPIVLVRRKVFLPVEKEVEVLPPEVIPVEVVVVEMPPDVPPAAWCRLRRGIPPARTHHIGSCHDTVTCLNRRYCPDAHALCPCHQESPSATQAEL